MSGTRTDSASGLLVTLATAAAVVLAACGGGTETKAAATKAASTPAAKTTAAATGAAGGGGAAAAAPAKGGAQADLVAKGKKIFQETAGGTGCALCHGMEARGDGAANMGAPNIRGAGKNKIQPALAGGVPAMGYIKLTPDELEAVAAFVESLAGQ